MRPSRETPCPLCGTDRPFGPAEIVLPEGERIFYVNCRRCGHGYIVDRQPGGAMAENALIDGAEAAMARVLEVLRAKNADYAGDGDPFRCFEAARLLDLHPLRGILLRMLDKVSRVSNLIESDPAVTGEGLRDAVDDLLGYSAIMAAYVERRMGS